MILPLAKMANGSMRDALSLLDRLISTGAEPLATKLLEEFLGCPNSEKINNLIAKIGDSDAAGTLAAVEDLITTGQSEVQIAGQHPGRCRFEQRNSWQPIFCLWQYLARQPYRNL